MRTKARHLYNALRGLKLAGPALGTRLRAFNAGGSFPGMTSTACILEGLRLVLRLTLADRPWEGWSPGTGAPASLAAAPRRNQQPRAVRLTRSSLEMDEMRPSSPTVSSLSQCARSERLEAASTRARSGR